MRPPRPAALRPLHRPGLWLSGWALMIAAVATGSLLPASELPTPPFSGIDKLEHLLGYAGLAGYAAMLFGPLRARAAAGAGLVLLGIAIEVAQGALTASRSADPADALSNALGVLAGLAIAATPLATGLQRLDARLRPASARR